MTRSVPGCSVLKREIGRCELRCEDDQSGELGWRLTVDRADGAYEHEAGRTAKPGRESEVDQAAEAEDGRIEGRKGFVEVDRVC